MMYTRAKSDRRGGALGLLDVGTSKIAACILVADPNGAARVAGLGMQRSRGVKSGVLTDLDAAEEAVRGTISQAERAAGITLENVVVSLACGRLKSSHFAAKADVPGGHVGDRDIARVMDAGRAYAERDGRALVHLNRLGFRLDGAGGIADARGLAARQIAADLHAVNPRLIIVRMPPLGLSGPDHRAIGFGWHFEDLAGLLRGFTHDLAMPTLVALIALPVSIYVLWHTPFGLRLRSCGEKPTAADSLAVPVYRMKYYGVVISGALAGLGGAWLVTNTRSYLENQPANRGFQGLAALVFGNYKPVGVAGGAGLFAYAQALTQRTGTQPVRALFLIAAIALAALALRSFYKRKLIKGGPFVPARIWIEQHVDGDGDLTREEVLRCEIGDRTANAADQWSYLAANPITEADYRFMRDSAAWAAEHAPMRAIASPTQAVNWMTAAPPF